MEGREREFLLFTVLQIQYTFKITEYQESFPNFTCVQVWQLSNRGCDCAILCADDQLSGFVLAGKNDVGKIDFRAAGLKVDRIQINLFYTVRNLHM